MLIRSLPEEERPLEKLIKSGPGALSTTELLALIIHTGTRDNSAIHLAEEVLSICDDGLRGMGSIGLDELLEIGGIGTSKACSILAAIELGKRMAASHGARRVALTNSDEEADLFMEELRYEKKEHFKSVMVNAKGEVISVDNVSVGELSSTIVHPREVFSQAIRKSAAGVILVHNHPSGDPSPSDEDIETTNRLVRGGQVLGIRVLDHIIIGDGSFSSLRAMELIK
ncbi:MAG: DNA repair protein RadC [Clostridiales bacterium]|nr:DNA repair protein RadC [Clostridiales bacterium]